MVEKSGEEKLQELGQTQGHFIFTEMTLLKWNTSAESSFGEIILNVGMQYWYTL